jgi:hypothetical protein
VIGPAPAGAACVHCHSTDGEVLKIKDAKAVGGKSETLHKGCTAAWFEAVK